MLVCEVVLINSLTLDGVSAKHFATTADNINLLSHSDNNDDQSINQNKESRDTSFFLMFYSRLSTQKTSLNESLLLEKSISY